MQLYITSSKKQKQKQIYENVYCNFEYFVYSLFTYTKVKKKIKESSKR